MSSGSPLNEKKLDAFFPFLNVINKCVLPDLYWSKKGLCARGRRRGAVALGGGGGLAVPGLLGFLLPPPGTLP